jgi:hypothetical protein
VIGVATQLASQPRGHERQQAGQRREEGKRLQRIPAARVQLQVERGVVAGPVDARQAGVVDPEQGRRQRREQRPSDDRQHTPSQRRR